MESSHSHKQSFNPITGDYHQLPETTNDASRIDDFLNRNQGKKCVVVQGLGFVGAVMSIVCANALKEDYAVIGIDLLNNDSYWKIKALNEGQFPIKAEDPQIEKLFTASIEKGNFLASYDPYAYSKADVIIVDINLDVEKKHGDDHELSSYHVELEGFRSAISTIGDFCKEDVLVLVETTVPPGTCSEIVDPTINQKLQQRGLQNDKWKLGHSYERVMPGPEYIDSIRNFYRVYSGINEVSADATESFLKTIISTEEYPLTRLGNTNATEMAKVLENSYRAMNISFIVEWTRFAEEAGVNLWEVVNAIRMRPTHKNIMLPGIGVGGYCLTKDPLLASWSRKNVFKGEALEKSENSISTNDRMPVYAFEFLKKNVDSLNDKSVLLLVVSYRQDVADTRSTPVEKFYDLLKASQAKVSVHDPHVTHWEEKQLQVTQDVDMLLEKDPNIIVISTAHSFYKNNTSFIDKLMGLDSKLIYDTLGLLTEEEIIKLSTKHRVLVLGRGDLKK